MGDELLRNGVVANVRIDLLGEIFATMWAQLRRNALTAAVAIVAAWLVNAQASAAGARQATVNDPQWQALNRQVTEAYGASDYKKGTTLAQAAFRLARRMFGDQARLTLTSLNNLATFYEALGRYREAEPLYREALQEQLKVLGPRHPDTVNSAHDLAVIDQAEGKYSEAERLYLEGLQARHEMLGPRHPDTLTPSLDAERRALLSH